MLEMNGIEFLGKIFEIFLNIVRILFIGYIDVEDLVEVINLGKVFKYIIKLWNLEELKVVVK